MRRACLAALDSSDSHDRTPLTCRLPMSIMLRRVILSSYDTNIRSDASGIISLAAGQVKSGREKAKLSIRARKILQIYDRQPRELMLLPTHSRQLWEVHHG
jgi:hypothetical protein